MAVKLGVVTRVLSKAAAQRLRSKRRMSLNKVADACQFSPLHNILKSAIWMSNGGDRRLRPVETHGESVVNGQLAEVAAALTTNTHRDRLIAGRG